MTNKSRFSALDVRAVCLDANSQTSPSFLPVGCRVLNIYDYTGPSAGRHALALKLQDAVGKRKPFVVIDPASRLHVSHNDGYHAKFLGARLSPLAAKLRKELRGRRLMRLEQCGWDRVLHLEFGFFSSRDEEAGGVHLDVKEEEDTTELDDENETKEGVENGKEGEDEMKEKNESTAMVVKAMHVYVELYAQGNVVLTDSERRILMLSRTVEGRMLQVGSRYESPQGPFPNLPTVEQVQAVFRIPKPRELKNALRALYPLIPNSLLDDAVRQKCSADFLWLQSRTIMERIKTIQDTNLRAYIDDTTFEPLDLSAYLKIALDAKGRMEFDSFNQAVDAYYQRLDSASQQTHAERLEQQATHKLAAIEREQQDRLQGLETARLQHIRQAQALEANVAIVEACLQVVHVALEQGMAWRDIEQLVEEERRLGRPLATHMQRFDWSHQVVFLKLALNNGGNAMIEEGVPVEFKDTAHGNINRLYDLAKRCQQKWERTCDAHRQAFKSAKAKIYQDLHMMSSPSSEAIIRNSVTRQTLWFQKFHWFLSSDRLLVLAGRDAHQNELLVKRHLAPTDIYVHADVTGAASVVIKLSVHEKGTVEGVEDGMGDGEPPIRTAHEAGQFACILSRAWDAKVVTAAWWVHGRQVSKSAPTGEYLPTGSFMVRGRKHWLPPLPLQAGFALVFLARRSVRAAIHDDDNDSGSGGGLSKAKEEEELRRLQAKYAVLSVNPSNADNAEEQTMELVESGNPLPLPPTAKSTPYKDKANNTQQIKASAERVKSDNQQASPIATKSAAPKRGQRSKQKRIQQKYGDQDEEERALRMRLLGHRPPPVPDKETSTSNRKQLEPAREKSSIVILNNSKPGEQSEESAAPGASELDVLDRLVIDASQETELVQAVPVFGPWMALKAYPHVLKLTPNVASKLGKGRLCKSILSMLVGSLVDGDNRGIAVRSLIKSIPDPEMQLTLAHSKVTIVTSGDDKTAVGGKNGSTKGKGKKRSSDKNTTGL